MADIVVFRPKAEIDAKANLSSFIDICRRQLTVFGSDLPFESDVWDVTEAVALKAKPMRRIRITFSNAATVDDPAPKVMREPFLSFAKAYVRYMHGMRPTKIIHNRMGALRALEAALTENGACPDPVYVDSWILNRASQIVSERFSAGAAYRVGGQLEMLAAFMAENRLTKSPVRWRNPIRRPSSSVRVGKEFDEQRAQKMPSAAALEALPRIFRLAKVPADVITASVAAILLSAPDRIGEVLTLPDACEVREPRAGKEDAYGLRWWPEKGAEPMVKWLVPSMSSVVEEALRKIRAVTDEPRRIAKWYEEHPQQIYLTPDTRHLRGQEWLSMEEVAAVIGLGGAGSANAWCKGHGVNRERRDKRTTRVYARFSDIEGIVLGMLPRGFPFLDKAAGLKYSQALFVVRRNELGSQRHTYRCMIEPVSIGQINTGLGSRTRHGFESIFTRLGFSEPDGGPIAITSHQFRHYLNTLAQAGGLSQLDIAKWSGRLDVNQNQVYDHVTSSEMLAKIRDTVGSAQMVGPLAELPKKVLIRRDEFSRLVIPTAHTTDIGYCIHDYAELPCQLHMDCINCQDFACVKGDAKKEAMLRTRLDEAKAFLANAEGAVKNGYSGSDRWMEHHRVTVDRLTQLCDILDDPAVPNGAVIQLATPKMPSSLEKAVGDQLEPPSKRERYRLTNRGAVRKKAAK
jgi:hypothetical protein